MARFSGNPPLILPAFLATLEFSKRYATRAGLCREPPLPGKSDKTRPNGRAGMRFIHSLLLGTVLLSPVAAHCEDSINDVVVRGDIKEVTRLIKANPELVNTKDLEDWVPIHYAVIADKNQYQLVEFLLKHGANVNAKSKYGDTPLSRAANRRELDVAKLLLRYKADVDAEDDDAWTPLDKAVIHCDQQMAALLLANKADPNLHIKIAGKDPGGTALHLAIDCKKDMVELLIANKADPGAKDWKGDTALSMAIDRTYLSNDQDLQDVIGVLQRHSVKGAP
jgi:ankyrin repeat protein